MIAKREELFARLAVEHESKVILTAANVAGDFVQNAYGLKGNYALAAKHLNVAGSALTTLDSVIQCFNSRS
jgi:hypothetical protein